MTTIAHGRRAFRALHEAGCFVIANPWDAGTARYLPHLGFKATRDHEFRRGSLARSARRGGAA